MSDFDFKALFILVAVISAIAAFITSTMEARKKFGTDYVSVAHRYFLNTFKTTSPILIYVAVCAVSGNWEKFLIIETMAVLSVTFFIMASHELSCGFGAQATYSINPARVAIVSALSLTGLTVSLTTGILVFIYGGSHVLVVIWQAFLLVASMATYYVLGSIVTLARAGYVPKKLSSHNQPLNQT